MTDAPAHIVIQRLTKRFGSVTAVRDVSLEIARGSFTTLLGPSGCGKTTILRTLAGFYEADIGDIFFSGRRMNDVPSHRRNAAMVFQDYALFPHMTVFENVAYGLKIAGLRGEALRRKVERVLTDLGLAGLEDRLPGMISGGQQQRVALARALVMEPEILLLDEPLSNLDAKLRVTVRAELRQIQRHVGITTVYVTHDQEEALALSDRIAVMSQGEVVQYGTPWEIYYTPQSVFVADFVGTANFIRGQVREAGPHRFTLDF
ncbi:MAG TPA: ABC transporter ATP-binding protein, partial [Candidatus Methylomirabilis sp.]